MNAFFAFVACLIGIVLVGFVVSRITGARSRYLASFPLDPGEEILWEDLLADAYPVPKRQAIIVSYRRARRSAVRVTNRRIVSAARPLFGAGHVVQHVLYPADRAHPGEADELSGGLFSRGYQTLLFDRAQLSVQGTGASAFVELPLSQSAASSASLSKLRIYSERLASFRLPD